ncbi:MAG TPA: STAS domain-containing protein [Bacteroidota bacterium]
MGSKPPFEFIPLGENRYALTGRLDASTAESLEAQLNVIETTVTLDLSKLQYISSAGLGVLLAAKQRLSDNDADLKLTGLQPQVRHVFDVVGFDKIFNLEK